MSRNQIAVVEFHFRLSYFAILYSFLKSSTLFTTMTYISTQIMALIIQRSATYDKFLFHENPSTYRIGIQYNNFIWQELQQIIIMFVSTRVRHSNILPLGNIVIQINLASLIILYPNYWGSN